MGIDIITMEDCASNYGIFIVIGSKGQRYTVTFNGSEGPAHCTCNGFRYHDDNCRHIAEVWEKACMYNPQWHDGKEHPELRPTDYTYTGFSSAKCRCGGPMVYVKRAV